VLQKKNFQLLDEERRARELEEDENEQKYNN